MMVAGSNYRNFCFRHLYADHVISTGHRMTNLVLNFECLFSFFFQPTLKSDLKEAQFNQNYLFWVKAPLWYLEVAPSLKTRSWLKKHNNNKYSKFNAKFVIWRTVKMTWFGPWWLCNICSNQDKKGNQHKSFRTIFFRTI